MTEQLARWLAASEYSDLQPTHSAAIQPLWAMPEGARLTELARASRITKQSMSALVDHLQRTGYVERVEDANDARAALVRLTPRGRALARAVRALSRSVEADWAERIGVRRIENLRETLEALRTSLLASDQ